MAFLKQFVGQHPRLTAWFVLAIGFVVILVFSARDVGFTAGQWAAVIVATLSAGGHYLPDVLAGAAIGAVALGWPGVTARVRATMRETAEVTRSAG